MTTLTATDANALLAELSELLAIPALDEGCEVCVSMLVEHSGARYDMASRRLRELVKTGELTEHPAIWRGRRVTAYRRT